MYWVYDLTLRILEGDIEAIITVSIPLGLMFYWIYARLHVLPGRQWKQPSGPKERTYFYRKKKVTEEEKVASGARAGAKAVKRETPADRPMRGVSAWPPVGGQIWFLGSRSCHWGQAH